jgi:hypothetical protein
MKQSHMRFTKNEFCVRLLRGVYTDWRSRVEVLSMTDSEVFRDKYQIASNGLYAF